MVLAFLAARDQQCRLGAQPIVAQQGLEAIQRAGAEILGHAHAQRTLDLFAATQGPSGECQEPRKGKARVPHELTSR
ncbi:hypothetical protein [Thiorhodovibrio winogradskyi]|uniref:hypothetical protein n=1 Tax=Thiorhodovibrio winogradskyi TaxID=77007 RepID=UPI002E2D0F01|nr:hypothetical protein [Thiorhodovibrio winogradskyi]